MKPTYLKRITLSTSLIILAIVTGYSQNSNFNQDKKCAKKTDTTQINETSHTVKNVYYTCPEHPKVRSDKPGNCPQCGLTMDKKIEKVVYSCPVHNEVKHDEKGQCEKCGAALEKKY
jgi:hypothetical protein